MFFTVVFLSLFAAFNICYNLRVRQAQRIARWPSRQAISARSAFRPRICPSASGWRSREEFGRRMVKAEFEPLASRFFHRTTFRNLAGLSLGFSSGGGFRAMRTRSLLDDSSDDLVLTINTEGTAHSTQLGREALAGPFDGVMMSCAEWGQFSVTEPARFILISVPRKPIAAMVKDPEAAAGRLLRRNGIAAIADDLCVDGRKWFQPCDS